LKSRIPAPLLGIVPALEEPGASEMANYIDAGLLRNT
jgi:hypothetical protein